MIKRFAPFYNRVDDEDREAQAPLRVLISTDVLSEGVNLQDCGHLVNYDLHWNPVRLMQRIGRVDRRMDPDIEEALVKADPSLEKSRGHIQVRNFLPPEEIEKLLALYKRVQGKILMISKTLGIPGGKLLDEDDMLDDTKVLQAFKDEYEGDMAPIEELRLKWLGLVQEDPGLDSMVQRLPDGIATAKTGQPAGLFVCRRVPVLTRGTEDDATPVWTMEPGRVQWALRTDDGTERNVESIDDAISCDASTDAQPFSDHSTLRGALRDLERDETKEYRKETQLPLDAPSPATICWMEVR